MKKKELDIKLAINHFFQMPNWKLNTAVIGGVGVIMMIISYTSSFVQGLGEDFIFIGMIINLISFPISLAYSMYISGYNIEIIRKTTDEGAYMDISVKENVGERFKNGAIFMLGSLVYSIPIIILLLITVFGLVVPLVDGSNEMMPFLIIGGLSGLLLLVYTLLYGLFWAPAMMINYANKATFASFFEIQALWNIVNRNISNLLIVFGTSLAAGIVAGIAYVIAGLTIFLCVGIILAPIVYAVGQVWLTHIGANLLGQVKVLDES